MHLVSKSFTSFNSFFYFSKTSSRYYFYNSNEGNNLLILKLVLSVQFFSSLSLAIKVFLKGYTMVLISKDLSLPFNLTFSEPSKSTTISILLNIYTSSFKTSYFFLLTLSWIFSNMIPGAISYLSGLPIIFIIKFLIKNYFLIYLQFKNIFKIFKYFLDN